MRNRQVNREKSPLNSYNPTYRETRLPSRKRSLGAWLPVVIATIAFLTGVIVLFTTLTIRGVELRGSTNKTLAQTAERLLKDNRGWNYIVSVPETELARRLEELHAAEIGEAKVTRNWFSRKVILEVTERRPLLNWQSGGKQYLLDQEGFVLGEGSGDYPVITDSTNLPVAVGKKIVPSQFVAFSVGVAADFKPITGIDLTGLGVVETTSELIAQTPSFRVRFDTTGTVREQLDNVKRVLATEEAKANPPAEYIDVRIPYKAYYR